MKVIIFSRNAVLQHITLLKIELLMNIFHRFETPSSKAAMTIVYSIVVSRVLLILARFSKKLTFPPSCHGLLIIGTTTSIKSLGTKNFIQLQFKLRLFGLHVFFAFLSNSIFDKIMSAILCT